MPDIETVITIYDIKRALHPFYMGEVGPFEVYQGTVDFPPPAPIQPDKGIDYKKISKDEVVSLVEELTPTYYDPKPRIINGRVINGMNLAEYEHENPTEEPFELLWSESAGQLFDTVNFCPDREALLHREFYDSIIVRAEIFPEIPITAIHADGWADTENGLILVTKDKKSIPFSLLREAIEDLDENDWNLHHPNDQFPGSTIILAASNPTSETIPHSDRSVVYYNSNVLYTWQSRLEDHKQTAHIKKS